jgi:hypothetical protein
VILHSTSVTVCLASSGRHSLNKIDWSFRIGDCRPDNQIPPYRQICTFFFHTLRSHWGLGLAPIPPRPALCRAMLTILAAIKGGYHLRTSAAASSITEISRPMATLPPKSGSVEDRPGLEYPEYKGCKVEKYALLEKLSTRVNDEKMAAQFLDVTRPLTQRCRAFMARWNFSWGLRWKTASNTTFQFVARPFSCTWPSE